MSSIILFGGSGFVGTHLAHALGDAFDTVCIADIRQPRWRCDKGVPVNSRAVYVPCDVRQPIDPAGLDGVTHIVNLAAVHTSPGHPAHEYFEANILGARNICAFAEAQGIDRIVFTSSISVYGPGEDEKREDSLPMPAIPYGSSKILAECVHREWRAGGPDRKLSILRPAVIFGVGEGGNFTRIANALERGLFAYPGRKDTVKGCLYVKDFCRLIIDRLNREEGESVYNVCYPEKITLQNIVTALKDALGYRAPEFVVPMWSIVAGAALLNRLKLPVIERMGLVPERIEKLVRSTNISSRKLMDSGFNFQYPLEEALSDWSKDCGGRTLF